ncbi:DUF1372 family protein [Streptococcus cristatus]|uniref:DUF1372 family protein n=1 Tax=Streptococcus cristatus TaxID=45634 RepID=A0A5B0DB67_STRCR|nr:DUF1372 family protein [Streptococcus cristatus]KAA0963162.1 DUF1372 family protein [Streptococcus cristatus]
MKFLPFLSIIVILLALVLAGAIKINRLNKRIEQLEARKLITIHRVDNAGGSMDMLGKITDKEVIEGKFTVTVGGYGKFLLTQEQYESIKVGDPIPDYLKGVGK